MTFCENSKHNQILRSTRDYCVYCQKNQLNWKSKHQQQEHQKQSFETDITNIEDSFRSDYRD